MHGSLKVCAISNCLSSSREKTIRRRGLYRSRMVRTYILPNEPEPPVMRMDLLSNMIVFQGLARWRGQASGRGEADTLARTVLGSEVRRVDGPPVPDAGLRTSGRSVTRRASRATLRSPRAR